MLLKVFEIVRRNSHSSNEFSWKIFCYIHKLTQKTLPYLPVYLSKFLLLENCVKINGVPPKVDLRMKIIEAQNYLYYFLGKVKKIEIIGSSIERVSK